ncbi:hypothetical protein DPMN_059281 [Dreissena polymorpha]|uniref:Uncharacterized protein n=1 Tax=Dreissena polymorpha TaxID=45954 RepID=A0A9D4C3Q1_DREPO|nr:hypothetical protein DPMN_059281 [Dreissena polymorpha]
MNRGFTGDDWDEQGTNGASSTATPPQSYCNAPVVAGFAPSPGIATVIGKPAPCQDATGIHRGSAAALPATTVGLMPLRYIGALHERCRLSPGLHPGITDDNWGSAGASPG